MGLHEMKKAQNARKALLIISDGGDNNSRYTETEVKNLVKEADVQIYAIGIYEMGAARGRTPEEATGPGLLTEVAEPTGGRQYEVDNINELPDIAAKIGVELRNQYILGYAPRNQERDGKYRRVQVKIIQPQRSAPSPGILENWAIMLLPINEFLLHPHFRSVAALLGPATKAARLKPAERRPRTGSPFSALIRRLVVCPTTVVDKTGHLVTDLPKSAPSRLRKRRVRRPSPCEAGGCARLAWA